MRNILLGLGLVGLFLGWNAPNHYPPWTAFHLEMFAGVGLCLIGAAVLGFDGRFPRRTFPEDTPMALGKSCLTAAPSARIWALLASLPLLQWLTGQLSFRGDAIIGTLYALGVAFALYVGQLWAAQRGSQQVLRVLFLTLTAAAVVACGLATAQWLHVLVSSWMAMELIDDRPFANFAQPNHFGLSMVMGLVALTALFETGAILRRWVYHLAIAFLIWGITISGSRASALALVAVAVLWLLTQHRVGSRLHPFDLLLATLVGLLLFVGQEPLHQLLLFRQTELRTTAEVGPRQWIWLHFWSAIQQRPWVGFGFNQAVEALASVAGQVHPSRNTVFAHNLVLDLMTWVGIPLALAMMAALIYWMTGWLRKSDDRQLMARRHWVLAIWLALLIQSMLEFPYAHTYFLLPAALLAGAATTLPGALHGPKPGVRLRASPWMQGLAAGTAAVFFLLIWEYFHMEADFRFNRFDRADFSTKVSHEAMEAPWVLDQLAALNASAHMGIAPGMPADQLEQLRRLARRFHILSIRLDYAKALAVNGRLAEAEQELLIIRSVYHPTGFAAIDKSWRLWLMSQSLPAPAGTHRRTEQH